MGKLISEFHANQKKMKTRCDWCLSDPIYIQYHDEEWGKECHDDRVLFEFLILESAQAGLSWLTVLKKRAGYKKAFANFDAKNYSIAALVVDSLCDQFIAAKTFPGVELLFCLLSLAIKRVVKDSGPLESRAIRALS